MKKLMLTLGILLFAQACSSEPSAAELAEARCKKMDEQVLEKLEQYERELNLEIEERKPYSVDKPYFQFYNSSFRTAVYMIAQNPSCSDPDTVAWAQGWVDAFNRKR